MKNRTKACNIDEVFKEKIDGILNFLYALGCIVYMFSVCFIW